MGGSFKTKKSMFGALFIGALAVVPAVLVAGILISIYQLIVSVVQGNPILFPSLGVLMQILMLAFVGVPFALVAAVVYGLPVYFILRKYDCINLYSVTAVALLPALIFAFNMQINHGKAMLSLYEFARYGYFSLWVAYTFWWFAPRKAVSS